MTRFLPRALMAPAVITLLLWMIVPLAMTIYFSLVRYNLMQPGEKEFLGLANFEYFVTDPDFGPSVVNTLLLLGSVIAITVVLGVGLGREMREDADVVRFRHAVEAVEVVEVDELLVVDELLLALG